jgi:hypothetical protein
LATSADGRADAPPRDGPPGFVTVLERHRLAWGDLTGNNRLDSFANLVEQPYIAMLFIAPGVEETLRLSGAACCSVIPRFSSDVRSTDTCPRRRRS